MNSFDSRTGWMTGLRLLLILIILTATAVVSLHAQTDTDFDEYKVRIDGFWFYSNPTGTLQDATTGDIISLHKDLAFSSYSTFTGKLDWKFTRKNHLYLVGASFNQSRQTVLQRTIMFHGQTFNVGVLTRANLSAPLIAPGYQYDIFRRRRWHLGLAVQFNLYNTKASLFAAAQVNTNNQVISARKSLLAPIPVAGPQGAFLSYELAACVRGRQPIRHVFLRLRELRFDVG